MHDEAEKRNTSELGRIAIVVLILVVVIWALTPVVLYLLFPDKLSSRGQIGDLFGVSNALFSGLALGGVVYAILLQRNELTLQRAELAANRIELSRSALAQEESREALTKTIYANSFRVVHETLESDNVVYARKHVITVLSRAEYRAWTEQHFEWASRVCAAYDMAGTMAKYGMLPSSYITETWGLSIVRVWNILAMYVEEQRKLRDNPRWMAGYEFLVQETDRLSTEHGQQRDASKMRQET